MTTHQSNLVTRVAAMSAVLLTFVAAACGGGSGSIASPASVATTSTTSTTAAVVVERPRAPVDELVSTARGRMHLRCVGTGPTTVLLIAGWGDGGENWGAIEPAIAEQSRVCSYARLGTGTSDPPRTTQTFATQAADLRALLDRAGEPGPYVVVGHSFGGAEAVTFASQHADDVTGLLLLDASPVSWPTVVCSVPAYEAGCAAMRDPSLDPERLDTFAAFEEVAAIRSLGDLPMTVMTAAHRTDPSLGRDELERLDARWAEGVERWAALSSSSRVVVVERTGHDIHLDQPDAVVAEVAKLLR